MRLDAAVVQQGITPSRTRAKSLILAGKIRVNGAVIQKPARDVSETDHIQLCGEDMPFVGRGGMKLSYALEQSGISLDGAICMDVGASTGGFTDCCLQAGAAKVYAIDVGHDQLAECLRKDTRVINLEGTNIRTLSTDHIPEKIDFLTMDVSFISLTLVLEKAMSFLKETGKAIVLIKPQFEAGKENVGKNGLVLSKPVHKNVLQRICNLFYENHISLRMLMPSPIRGGEGNIEYLAVLEKSETIFPPMDINEVVEAAFSRKENEK